MDMDSISHMVAAIEAEGVVAVVRMSDPEHLFHVVGAAAEGGVRAIEITMTVPGALDQIAAVHEEFGEQILLGVGSVRDEATARDAVAAGARFVVSPIFFPEIIEAAHDLGVPAMPGCFTPTEIASAVRAGADVVKVFPADIVGMKFFKAVRAPMPDLKLMPTGGVSLTNAGEWLAAGACAVGIGSALIEKDAVAKADFQRIRRNAETVRKCIDDYRAAS
jgi:2-dehydro-3-deoxyphosphogluconate aldolase/(4S)-4-hydroxy-2-oxoglutarate aldolase